VFVVCWSVKGGVGTSVTAAALALRSAANGRETLLVDLAGDQPAVLGCPPPTGAGVGDWMAGGDDVPVDALRTLEVSVQANLSLLPYGQAPSADRLPMLASVLSASSRDVVVDAGVLAEGPWWASDCESVLVLRSCYLAVRRAGRVAASTRVVLIEEPGRALNHRDIAAAIGVEPWRRVSADPAVARCVDAGLLSCRLPRSLRTLELAR